jgi:hypothetical protein
MVPPIVKVEDAGVVVPPVVVPPVAVAGALPPPPPQPDNAKTAPKQSAPASLKTAGAWPGHVSVSVLVNGVDKDKPSNLQPVKVDRARLPVFAQISDQRRPATTAHQLR